ncbi:MAG: hypothetical protein AAGK14_11740, partial [Verrucomicrobiota bacterium]
DPAERLVAYWQLDVDYTEAEWDRSDANRLPEDADGEDIKAFAENLAVETALLTLAERVKFEFTGEALLIHNDGSVQAIAYDVLERDGVDAVRLRFEDGTELRYEFMETGHLRVPYLGQPDKFLFLNQAEKPAAEEPAGEEPDAVTEQAE